MKRPVFSLALSLLCLLSLAAFRSRHAPAQGPRCVPAVLQGGGAGTRPQVHVFVRHGCRACEHHLQELDQALASLPDSLRRRATAGVCRWEVGSTHRGTPHRRLPLSSSALGIRATPVTWFVGRQDSIVRRWVGTRNRAVWRHALLLLQEEKQ
jgi:hypothetical protein